MVIASWVVPGLWSGPRHNPELLQEAATRVMQVPMEFGDWRGKATEFDREELEQAGAIGYWARQYSRRNQTLLVLLMCGRAGRMAVHTPEFCYQGLGYELVDSPRRAEVEFGPQRRKAEFWTARFTKPIGAASDLRLFWTWSDGEGWKAPASPRWQFRRAPFLYKLYIVHGSSAQQQWKDGPAMDFLPPFLAELERALLSTSGT